MLPRAMLPKAITILATLGAIIAILLVRRSAVTVEPLIGGHKNRVLIISDSHHGLCNVHLATGSALLENHPTIEVHYASLSGLASDVARISENARARNPNSKGIHWHLLNGTSATDELSREIGGITELMAPPGVVGQQFLEEVLVFGMAAWPKESHWSMHRQVSHLIQEVDPAVVVLDYALRPAVDASRDLNRVRAFVTPNALPDIIGLSQPWGAHFWKYPAMGSGLPFPIPWHKIPLNFYLQLRPIISVTASRYIDKKRSYLRRKGVGHPIYLFDLIDPEIPWITMAFPEAGLPMDFIPDNIEIAGPMVLDEGPVETQDAELAAWLKRAPTMLVNLGSLMRYDEQMARVMAESFAPVLEATNTQILWKMRKAGEYDDQFLESVNVYIKTGRLRIESWIAADPVSLLNSGDIVVAVHHGGANCYFETVLAGIPHVILPLWADTYNFANTAEYLGVGVWPSKAMVPKWESAALTEGFMTALSGEKSVLMRQKAKALGEKAREYGGSKRAAEVIAKMAAQGK